MKYVGWVDGGEQKDKNNIIWRSSILHSVSSTEKFDQPDSGPLRFGSITSMDTAPGGNTGEIWSRSSIVSSFLLFLNPIWNHMCLALAPVHSSNTISIIVHEAGEVGEPRVIWSKLCFTDKGPEVTSSPGNFQTSFYFLGFLLYVNFVSAHLKNRFPFLNTIFPLCRVVSNSAKAGKWRGFKPKLF